MVKNRSNQKNRNNPVIRFYIVMAVILVVGLGSWFAKDHFVNDSNSKTTVSLSSTSGVRPQNSVKYSPSTPNDSSISNSNKSGTISSTQNTKTSTPSQTSPSAEVTITQVDASNDPVIVRSIVSGASSGTCTLQISQSGQQTITLTNSVTLQNSTYYCPNFSIPYSDFPVSGNWQFNLELTTDSGSTSNTWPEPVYITKS